MNKEQIIGEIQRTAKTNGGKALGNQRFEAETGIKRYDWYGRFWSRWSDAVPVKPVLNRIAFLESLFR